MAIMLPNGTLVNLVRNNHFGWQAHYQALAKGEQREYRIIGNRSIPQWDNPVRRYFYYCCLVDKNGKRRGSYTYHIFVDEVEPVIQMELEDWL